MRKRFGILFALAVVGIVGGLTWWIWRPLEPTYKGKRLSVWLKDYDDISYPREKWMPSDTDEAVRQMGTNLIPTLLGMIREQDSPLMLKLNSLLERQSIVEINVANAHLHHHEAFLALEQLGFQAKSAVPALIEIHEHNASPDNRNLAVYALSAIGPAAEAAILSMLKDATNANPERRAGCAWALGHIPTQPEKALSALVTLLSDNESYVRDRAAKALGAYGAAAKPAIPALVELLRDHDYRVRDATTNALRNIDPEAAARAGVQPATLHNGARASARFNVRNLWDD